MRSDPNTQARQIVRRRRAGEPLDPAEIDFMAEFVETALRAGGRARSEARSKIEGRNQVLAAVADVLFPKHTPSAAGRCLEALAREWTPDQAGTVPAAAAALLARLAATGLPGPKQVENIIREHRKRNVLEITSE